MIGSGGVKSKACWSGSRNRSCSISSLATRASASSLTSSSCVSLSRFLSLAASFSLLSITSSSPRRDAVIRYSTDTPIAHPLVSDAKKNQNTAQLISLTTTKLPILTIRPLGRCGASPMGLEREHIGARILAANKELIELLRSLVPLSESATVDEILTHVRLRIAAGDLSVVPHFYKAVLREHCEQASTGAEPRKAESWNMPSSSLDAPGEPSSAAMPTVPIPLPKKSMKARAEKAS